MIETSNKTGTADSSADTPCYAFNFKGDVMKTLQELLETKVKSEDKDGNEIAISPDFRVAVQASYEIGTHIIIHPLGHNGDTLDLLIKGDSVSPFFPHMQRAERL